MDVSFFLNKYVSGLRTKMPFSSNLVGAQNYSGDKFSCNDDVISSRNILSTFELQHHHIQRTEYGDRQQQQQQRP